MKRLISQTILALLVIGLAANPVLSQDAKNIIEKSIEAQGGKKLLGSIEDITMTGTLEIIQQGLSGDLTRYWKPGKTRFDLEVMGMQITQAYDGETAWMLNPQTGLVEEMPENAAQSTKRDAMGIEATLNPEKYGITYEYKGKETIEGKEYFLIMTTYKDGFSTTSFIDTKTYLTYKTMGTITDDTMGMEIEVESIASDYKEVNGITMSHTTVQYRDGEEYLTISISDVKINTGIDDSIFVMDK
ncbi:outer membrane lipoprotein carrier protein LolA [Acidobacteriota bacterium]